MAWIKKSKDGRWEEGGEGDNGPEENNGEYPY